MPSGRDKSLRWRDNSFRRVEADFNRGQNVFIHQADVVPCAIPLRLLLQADDALFFQPLQRSHDRDPFVRRFLDEATDENRQRLGGVVSHPQRDHKQNHIVGWMIGQACRHPGLDKGTLLYDSHALFPWRAQIHTLHKRGRKSTVILYKNGGILERSHRKPHFLWCGVGRPRVPRMAYLLGHCDHCSTMLLSQRARARQEK